MGGEEYDDWNFIRAAYNQFAFPCYSQKDCQKTEIIRKGILMRYLNR